MAGQEIFFFEISWTYLRILRDIMFICVPVYFNSPYFCRVSLGKRVERHYFFVFLKTIRWFHAPRHTAGAITFMYFYFPIFTRSVLRTIGIHLKDSGLGVVGWSICTNILILTTQWTTHISNKLNMLKQCWLNHESALLMVSQHLTSIGSKLFIPCWFYINHPFKR